MNNCARHLSHLHFYFRVRFAVNIFYVNLLWTTTVYPHRRFTSFGSLADVSLGYTPTGLSVSQQGGTPEIVVTAKQSSTLYFYRLTRAGALVQHGSFKLAGIPRYIVSLESTGAPQDTYAALCAEGISLVRKSGGSVQEKVIPITTEAERIVVADINNDKRSDICLFGKRMSGVTTLLGQSGGGFRPGPLLFPEVSVSDLKTADINGDGITDVVLLNWLSDQLTVFYGIGQGIYAEQVAVDLPGTPNDLAISAVTRDRTMQVVTTLPNKHALATLRGNSTGEFDITGTIDCTGEPSGIMLGRINDDQYLDIVSSTGQGIAVYLGQSATDFGPATEFGVASSIHSWLLADLDGDGKNDLVFIDATTKRLGVLSNADWSGNIDWPAEYAVGASPMGLLSFDCNGDGLTDVAVVNSVSSTLSILLNVGRGRLSGQQSLRVAEEPTLVNLVQQTGTGEQTLVTSHAGGDKVTVIQLTDEIHRSSSFTVPTGSNPDVILAKADAGLHQMEMLVRCRDPKDATPSLSLFKQISGGQFLERSIISNIRDKITALNVDEQPAKGKYELFVVTNNTVSKQSTISRSVADQEFDFGATTPLISFPDPLACTHSIFTGLVNGDTYKDIVIGLDPPRNELGILYARKDGFFHDSLEWIRNVHPLNTAAIDLCDVDGDGHVDIVLVDSIRNSIVVLYGRESGRFGGPTQICPAQGVSAFRIASLRRQGVQDLILANTMRGTISIMWDPFRR